MENNTDRIKKQLQTAFGQTINNILIQDIDLEYVQTVGIGVINSNTATIQIDFGRHDTFFVSGKETAIRDENGKPD